MKQKTQKYWKNKCDKLWSEHFKGPCILCGKPGFGHHIIGRRHLSVRHDLDNGVSLCAYHHTFSRDSAHQNPLWFREQLVRIKGEKFLMNLLVKSQVVCYTFDGEAVYNQLKGKTCIT